MEAPVRKQGENAASILNIPGPAIDSARIHPRLAPGGFYEQAMPRRKPGDQTALHPGFGLA